MKLVARRAVIVVVAIAIVIVVRPTAKAEREVSESIAIPIVVVVASHPAVVELAASQASEGAGLASRDAAAFGRAEVQARVADQRRGPGTPSTTAIHSSPQ